MACAPPSPRRGAWGTERVGLPMARLLSSPLSPLPQRPPSRLVGIRVLEADGRVFPRLRWNTIYYSELGSSTAILDAGYNLDCFMAKYPGLDWRNSCYWDCNMRWGGGGVQSRAVGGGGAGAEGNGRSACGV